MLDVHAPHERMHGWRDFLLHLFTITVGLLIALSLEGIVEWQHHRHLVREARASLVEEIRNNSAGMTEVLGGISKNQADLKHDIAVLNTVVKAGKAGPNEQMNIAFGIREFRDTAWRTAQSTGALGYMSYDEAQRFSSIYRTQEQLLAAEQQAGRDAIVALAPFAGSGDSDPTAAEAAVMKPALEVYLSQLLLVQAFAKDLDHDYKDFLQGESSH